MSRMKNRQPDLIEQARFDARYQAAMASLNAKRRVQERNGYAVMAAAMSYGEASLGNGRFAKITHAAKLGCILFAFATPPALVWHLLL